MTVFEEAFALVVGEEGGFGADPRDVGNWTGGRIGVGVCRGTKFGISAASYPTLDIQSLTLDQARDIYRVAYWSRIGCDRLEPSLALILFDTAVNSGTGQAVRWLQQAIDVPVDGLVGLHTLAAIAALPRDHVATGLLSIRLHALTTLPTWSIYGGGWGRRIVEIGWHAAVLSSRSSS